MYLRGYVALFRAPYALRCAAISLRFIRRANSAVGGVAPFYKPEKTMICLNLFVEIVEDATSCDTEAEVLSGFEGFLWGGISVVHEDHTFGDFAWKGF